MLDTLQRSGEFFKASFVDLFECARCFPYGKKAISATSVIFCWDREGFVLELAWVESSREDTFGGNGPRLSEKGFCTCGLIGS
jgi:hypothetical protein